MLSERRHNVLRLVAVGIAISVLALYLRHTVKSHTQYIGQASVEIG
jgi:hypothetical protein